MSDFFESRAQGDIGELMFLEAHKGQLIKDNTRGRDFTLLFSDEGVELKSDFFSFEKTPNFFFERYSNTEFQTAGGPWRAKEEGTRWFVYLFVDSLTAFRFDVNDLVRVLDEIAPTLELRSVKNRSWTTLGYLVPRDLLAPIFKQYNLIGGVTNNE